MFNKNLKLRRSDVRIGEVTFKSSISHGFLAFLLHPIRDFGFVVDR
jgi:hypothetical protein